MSLPIAFWDSSALIPLCVSQPQTPKAKSCYKSYGIVIWWATPVEIISGLTRLQRMIHISQLQFDRGKQQADALAVSWVRVEPIPEIASSACALLELYPLRAADALQLASAMEYFGPNHQGSVFVTADLRLADAARQSGFSVELL